MKILAVFPYAPSLIRVRPYNLLRELGRRHDLTVFIAGPRPDDDERRSLQAIAEEIHVAPPTIATAAWSCAHAAVTGAPLQAAANRSPAAEAGLRALLDARQYDVVHVEHLRAGFLAAAIPDGTPCVFDAVDCISLLWERTQRASHSILRRLLATVELAPTRRYETRLLRRFREVAVTSPEDGDALRALAPGASVSVVPNGVDLDYFRPVASPREPRTLVFSGKMSYHANVTAVLHFVRSILPRVRAAVPDVRLRIVGKGPPAVVERLADDPLIDVTGYVPDLRPAIGRASVAVCPVTVKVGIQNKILEAMAMGVPVVASAQGATGLTATAGEELLVADGAEAFARHVVALLTDDALHARIAQAGRRYVERVHRWDAAAAAFEDLYRRAASPGRVAQPGSRPGGRS